MGEGGGRLAFIPGCVWHAACESIDVADYATRMAPRAGQVLPTEELNLPPGGKQRSPEFGPIGLSIQEERK